MAMKSRRKYRKRPLPPAPDESRRMYVRIDPSKVALFRFLLEGCDNLGMFTVVNRFKGTLLLRYSPHQEREMRAFLGGIRELVPMQHLGRPPFRPE